MVDSAAQGDPGEMSDAALAARDFRVALEHRRDIDDLVAEAVAIRQRATVEAADVVRDAESLARAIVADARTEAARLTAQAEQALAAASAERHLADEARSEHVSATIGRLESMASDVQMVLDSALAEVAESLSPPADRPRPAPAPAPVAAPAPAAVPDPELLDDTEDIDGPDDIDDLDDLDDIEVMRDEDPGAPGSEPVSGPDSGPRRSGWTDNIPDRGGTGAAEARSERWRDRFRQTR